MGLTPGQRRIVVNVENGCDVMETDTPSMVVGLLRLGAQGNPMTRTKTIVVSLVLLAVPLVALLAANPASAHICTAQDPKTSCGGCQPGTGLYHDHNYNNGSNYCNSIGYILGGGDGTLP